MAFASGFGVRVRNLEFHPLMVPVRAGYCRSCRPEPFRYPWLSGPIILWWFFILPPSLVVDQISGGDQGSAIRKLLRLDWFRNEIGMTGPIDLSAINLALNEIFS